MGEFELIRHYFAAAPCAQAAAGVALGIGDDCALLELPAGEQLAISTDTLVAGVHFPDPCDAFLLGQRVLAVAASDLAAMGATPLGFTLALCLPQAAGAWLQDFARGLNQMAAHCGLALIGGDTTRGPLSLTVTVFGRLPRGQALLRSGAQVGDLLCVGGSLGDAAAALPLVLGQQQAAPEVSAALLAQYWSPRPQLALGQALRGIATSAIDISDGLLGDVGHILRQSRVGARIDTSIAMNLLANSIQLTRATGLFSSELQLEYVLAGGDDYELAFTAPAAQRQAVQAAAAQAQTPVTRIGAIEAETGVRLHDADGSLVQRAYASFDHFA